MDNSNKVKKALTGTKHIVIAYTPQDGKGMMIVDADSTDAVRLILTLINEYPDRQLIKTIINSLKQ